MNENCYLTGKSEVYSKSGSSQILYLMLRLHVWCAKLSITMDNLQVSDGVQKTEKVKMLPMKHLILSDCHLGYIPQWKCTPNNVQPVEGVYS